MTSWLSRLKRHRAALETAPGVLGSLLLHGLGLGLLLFLFMNRVAQERTQDVHVVPVDLVALGRETSAPPAPLHALSPQQQATHGPSGAPKPQGVRPRGKPVPDDALAVRLKALSKLRQPNSDLTINTEGTSDMTATSPGAAPGPAAYSVQDYIRAQVLRRWNLDLTALGTRDVVIALRVRLTARGAIDRVTILDHNRYKKDKMFREVALSARNAVILSAPFDIPDTMGRLDFTMRLDPRDTLR